MRGGLQGRLERKWRVASGERKKKYKKLRAIAKVAARVKGVEQEEEKDNAEGSQRRGWMAFAGGGRLGKIVG